MNQSSPLTVDATMITVTLRSINNADAQRTAFAKKAVEKMQVIVNDPRFAEKLQSANYTGRRFRNDAGRLVDASNGMIRQIITGGKERKTRPDGIIDLHVTFARLSRRRTVGFVSPPSPLITTNTRFADEWQPRDYLSLASHWMHEWMHVAGFRHRPDDRTDVAYSIGRFVKEVGRALAHEEGLDKALVQELGEGYEKATKPGAVDCPVFESCVAEEYMDFDI
jgi:hypothetical protein